jgi:hypothetical protein
MEGQPMSPNVHMLDRARTPQREVQKPSRAEVEAAVRTIIRWTGEDPERDGLIETPARVTRSFEEFFSGYAQDPVEILEKTFDEIEGYDEMIAARHPLREPLRAPHGADYRPSLGCLYSKRPRSRHLQAGPSGGRLRQAAADPGKDDGAKTSTMSSSLRALA